MKARSFSLVAYLGLAVASQGADTVVFSPDRVGNSDSIGPFGQVTTSSMRYQQVYRASDFSNLGAGGGWLTALSFQYSSTGPQLGGVLSNAQINFSTTTRAVDSLSPVFAQNIGINDQIVIGPGPLNMFAQVDPQNARLIAQVPLTTPFYYNPASGNLLMDVRVFSGYPTRGDPSMSASSFGFDGSSRVWADGVSSASGTADTIGLITGFRFAPVPEPSALALLGIGILSLIIFGIRNKAAKQKESMPLSAQK